jgi:hypothetical protein
MDRFFSTEFVDQKKEGIILLSLKHKFTPSHITDDEKNYWDENRFKSEKERGPTEMDKTKNLTKRKDEEDEE